MVVAVCEDNEDRSDEVYPTVISSGEEVHMAGLPGQVSSMFLNQAW